MNDANLSVFLFALLGGLTAGIICSVVLVATSGAIIQNVADYALNEIQNLSIDCSEDPTAGSSTVTLGDQVLYCSLRVREKGQEKEVIVDLAPGGDLSN